MKRDEAAFLRAVDATIEALRPAIFVGSSSEGLKVAQALRRTLESHETVGTVTLWRSDELFRPSQVIFNELMRTTRAHDFAVLLATADDQLIKRGKKASSMRDNVLFEFGLFAGALGHERAFLLVPQGSELALPSDLGGMLHIRYDQSTMKFAVKRILRAIADAKERYRRAVRSYLMGRI